MKDLTKELENMTNSARFGAYAHVIIITQDNGSGEVKVKEWENPEVDESFFPMLGAVTGLQHTLVRRLDDDLGVE